MRPVICTLAVVALLAPIVMAQAPGGTRTGAAPAGCNQPMSAPSAHIPVNGEAIGPVVTRDGCWIFMSIRVRNAMGGIAVFRRGGGEVEQVRFVPVDPPNPGLPWRLALTHDEKTLVAAADRQVAFLEVRKLISGQGDPVLGFLTDPRLGGTNNVMVTPDDRHLFVSNAWTAQTVVVDLPKALASRFSGSAIIGGVAAAGGVMMTTPDQRFVLMASSDAGFDWPLKCQDPEGRPNGPANQRQGGFLVIDREQATREPGSSVLHAVPVGCNATGIALAPDGNTLYATAEKSVYVFDMRPIWRGAPPVLTGNLPVGGFMRGAIVIDGGKRVVVPVSAERPQTAKPTDRANLVVIDATRIGEGAQAVVGSIPAGADPLGLSLTSDGRTLLVGNRVSGTLQIVDVDRLLPTNASAGGCNQPMPDPIVHVKVPGGPWSAVSTHDGCWIFVAIGGGGGNPSPLNGVAVLRRDGGAVTQVRFVSTPGKTDMIALTHDEKLLLVPADDQVALLSVEKLVSGDERPVISHLGGGANRLGGAGPVASSPDDAWMFVTERETARISVFDLKNAGTRPGRSAEAQGRIPLGGYGLFVLSPDGRYLYATSLLPPAGYNWDGTCTGTAWPNEYRRPGALLVLDVAKATVDPSSALLHAVPGGCAPRSLSVSPDGNTVYMTVMEDEVLRAYDVRPVRNGLPPRLQFTSRVGQSPGQALVIDNGKRIVVINSPMKVLDAVTGIEAGTIPAGTGPARASITHDGRTLLLANREGGTLQLVDLARIPLEPASAATR